MKTATVKLRSLTPATFGKYHMTEKKPKELPVDYEKRTWKEKCHYNSDEMVIIPSHMLANCYKKEGCAIDEWKNFSVIGFDSIW